MKLTSKHAFIILSIIAVAFVVYLQIYFPGDFTTNFAADLFATLFGVIIGMSGAEWINSQNRKGEETRKRNEIIDSILAELDTNKQFNEKNDTVKEKPPKTSEPWIFKYTTSGYDSAIASGKYHLLSLQTQRNLTFHYEGLRRWNDLADILGDLTRHGLDLSMWLLKELQECHSALNKSFPDVQGNLLLDKRTK